MPSPALALFLNYWQAADSVVGNCLKIIRNCFEFFILPLTSKDSIHDLS